MRDIKFRVWDKSGNKFVCCFQSGIRFTLDTGQIYINGTNFTDSFEIMQFTGLQDKNGVDIYEGDIVLVSGNITKSGEQRFAKIIIPSIDEGIKLVALDNGAIYGSAYIVKVIGNIHENPELLGDL